MMASIPNMRSTPLTLPGAKTPATGDAAPGDFAAQLPAAPGQPIEAVLLPSEAIAEPTAPSLPAPEDLKSRQAADGERDGNAPEAKTVPSVPDQPETPVVVIPFLQNQPVAPAPQPVAAATTVVPAAVAARATPPAETPASPLRTLGGKTKGKACDPDGGRAGLPVADDAEAKADAVEVPEIEAAMKELLQRKQSLATQTAAAPKPANGPAAGTEAALAQTHGHALSQVRSETPVAIQTVAPVPTAELPQPAAVSPMPQAEPVTTEKTGSVAGTRSTELSTERRLDLAREGRWLDRLARDIAQAGANDAPLRFRLHPQTLGSLHVELQQGDHGTAVRLTVATEAARQILTDAQPRLAAEARAQGVRIAETHVDLSGSGRQAPGDQRRQDEAGPTPMIRTARGVGPEAAAAAGLAGRARLDRYA